MYVAITEPPLICSAHSLAGVVYILVMSSASKDSLMAASWNCKKHPVYLQSQHLKKHVTMKIAHRSGIYMIGLRYI